MLGSTSACTILLLASWLGVHEERTWTDTRGKKLTGTLVEQVGDQVTIESDGKKFTLPVSRFCDEDQAYLKSLSPFVDLPPQTTSPEKPAEPGEAPAKGETPAKEAKKKPANEERMWTDNTNRKIKARFVRMNNGNVVLQNASVFNVPFYNLSDDDQTFIREILESRGQEGQIPPKPIAGTANNRPGGNGPGNPGAFTPPVFSPPSPPNNTNDFTARMQEDARRRQEEMQARFAKSQADAAARDAEFKQRIEQQRKEAEERAQANARRMEQDRLAREANRNAAMNPSPSFPSHSSSSPVASNSFPRPQPIMEDVYQCDKCRRTITTEQAKNNLSCPHCGVFWTSKPAEVGGMPSGVAARQVGFYVGLLVGGVMLIGIIAIPIVIIVLIVRAASKPAAPQSPFGRPRNPYD